MIWPRVVNMPLLFTSTALVPARQMPPWLERLAVWNPLTLVTDALRDALLLGQVPDVTTTLLTLAGLAGLLFLAARAPMVRRGRA